MLVQVENEIDIQEARRLFKEKNTPTLDSCLRSIRTCIGLGYKSTIIEGRLTEELRHELQARGFTVDFCGPQKFDISGWRE